MKLKWYACALMLSIGSSSPSSLINIFSSPSSCAPVVTSPTPSHWSIAKTMMYGSFIGGTFGAINYATDFFFPFNWLYFSVLRHFAVDNIVQEAHKQSEYINKNLLSDTAWASDWAAYILLCQRTY